VAISRAIVNEPPILFADEPSGNLDTKTTREVMDLLKNLNEEGMTIVMVTHSPECAGYARRMLRISDGRLVEDVPLNGSRGGIQAVVC
jgi:putative ABC transport system ATP-binding protein